VPERVSVKSVLFRVYVSEYAVSSPGRYWLPVVLGDEPRHHEVSLWTLTHNDLTPNDSSHAAVSSVESTLIAIDDAECVGVTSIDSTFSYAHEPPSYAGLPHVLEE